MWYVNHWSLLLDLRILLMTIKCVVMRTGISHGGEATMPVFTGKTGAAQVSSGHEPHVRRFLAASSDRFELVRANSVASNYSTEASGGFQDDQTSRL